MLLPGFVDLQVNAYVGVELMTAGAGRLGESRDRPAGDRHDGFLPTFITAPPGALASSLWAAAVHVPALPGRVGRICPVMDTAAGAGMPAGRCVLGGEPIELAGDGEPAVRADGTLAGSALRMDAAVANMVAAGIGLAAAAAAASRVPADLIGRPDLGRITRGEAAYLTWLNDDLRTRATWRGGELVYSRTGDRPGGSAAVTHGGPS